MTRRMPCRASVFLAAFSLLPQCLFALAADRPATTLTLNERVYLASRVYASLANFAHWQNAPDLDLEAAYRVYLDKAIASPRHL